MSAREQPGPDTEPALNILDSVCVLYFTACGQLKLLVEILTAANYVILIPHEVLGECTRKARQQRWDISGLHAAIGARIKLIPEITAATPQTMRALANIRRGHPKGIQGSANLGECVCITHALGAQMKDIPVVVSLDDGDGQALATAKGVAYLTIEDALVEGVRLGVVTRPQARGAYKRMVPYGASLPSWEASELRRRLRM